MMSVDNEKYDSILRHLERSKIDECSRLETRQRDKVVPAVSAYRWWARRTLAVTGGILKAYRRVRGSGGLIADPFAGGGMVPLAALSLGYRVYAQDINSWAAHGLATTLRLPHRKSIREAFASLSHQLKPLLEKAYETSFVNGDPATISHTLRVASVSCPCCQVERKLFPHALVSMKERKDVRNTGCFLACSCGHLFEHDGSEATECPLCQRTVTANARYLPKRQSICHMCEAESSLDQLMAGSVVEWKPVLVQRVARGSREIGAPTEREVAQASEQTWTADSHLGAIPKGVETRVLIRHGFRTWESVYPVRQRALLESLLEAVEEVPAEPSTRSALRLAAVGVAETAGYLSRWDRWYLKNYESMALHRFNLTTLPAEPNVWGAHGYGRGTFSQRVNALMRASQWLEEEVTGSVSVVVDGPRESTQRRRSFGKAQNAMVVVGSSERMLLPNQSVDLVLTDPPYHDDIQYAELSLPLQAWAGLATHDARHDAAMNGVNGNAPDQESYLRVLSKLFREVHRVLHVDGRLIFSYANREPRAWIALFDALQSTGFYALAYQVVHAENETGLWKQGAKSCDFDLLLEAAPRASRRHRKYRPRLSARDPETMFLRTVGEQFLQVGSLPPGWEEDFRLRLSALAFLA